MSNQNGDDEYQIRLAQNLTKALGAIPKDRDPPFSSAEGRRKAKMALPPGLVEEAAKMLFAFWEDQADAEKRRRPIHWEQLAPQYQVAWLEITRITLEMTISVMMTDIHRYLDGSNGDMGAAFSRALRRYAEEVLNTKIRT